MLEKLGFTRWNVGMFCVWNICLAITALGRLH